jgi:hypothetical protein
MEELDPDQLGYIEVRFFFTIRLSVELINQLDVTLSIGNSVTTLTPFWSFQLRPSW